MPHVHPLYINKLEEHLAKLTKFKFKKHNYETIQTIKNGFLFTLDFPHSTYLVDYRNRSHLILRGLYVLHFSMLSQNLYTLLPSPPPNPNPSLLVPLFSMTSSKSIYYTPPFPIPFPSSIIIM